MASERFAEAPWQDPRLSSEWQTLTMATKKVCLRKGIFGTPSTFEDKQSDVVGLIIQMGGSEIGSHPVILRGWVTPSLDEAGGDENIRFHELTVPDNHPEIIDEVKQEVARIKEARKFVDAPSSA